MFTQLLYDVFRSLSLTGTVPELGTGCHASLEQAVEHVVDKTFSRVRALPGYAERLRMPVRTAFSYIDQLVEGIPEAILCCRSAYGADPKVNAFFANVHQLCEVFSHSQEVRAVFDQNPQLDECWALLCMHKEERQRFGMALIGDEVRKEVMQTGVSFTDHQLVSPGTNEEDARRSLKCCIFGSLLGFIRRETQCQAEKTADLENRRRSLLGKKRSASEPTPDLDVQLEQIEAELAAQALHLNTLEERLAFIAEVLGNPSSYISGNHQQLRLSRMGIKLNEHSSETGNLVSLTEIHIARHQPRIAALVRFPRAELLPERDYLQQADMFLAV